MGNTNLTNLSIRIDKNTKKNVEDIFDEMGINMTCAITMFLKQVERDKCFPFAANINHLSAESINTIKEASRIGNDTSKSGYVSIEELKKALDL